MTINIEEEKLLTISQASHRCPNRPHTSTLYRWFTSGVGGVRLETAKLGGRCYTSSEALQRFFQALTEADGSSEHSKPNDLRSSKKIDEELDELGI